MFANVADWRVVATLSTRPYYIGSTFPLKSPSEKKDTLRFRVLRVTGSVSWLPKRVLIF